MRTKRFFAIMVAVALVFTISIPVFAASADGPDLQQVLPGETDPAQAPPELENELPVETAAPPELENELPVETAAPPDIEDVPPSEPPEPLAFYVDFYLGGNGYIFMGYFPGYTPDIKHIETFYSFDGETFKPVDPLFDWTLPEDTSDVENPRALVAGEKDAPLREYLAGEEDSVYIRLHYKTEEGSGISQVFSLIRPTQAIPLPEDITVWARYPKTMQSPGRPPTYQYNITVRAETTVEALNEMLPDTLPIQVQLVNSNRILANTLVNCGVEWNLPEILQGEVVTVEDAIKAVIPPQDLAIEGLGCLYMIEPFPQLTDTLKLVINRVDTNGTFDFALHADQQGGDWGSLFVTFPLKPSGATVITPSYSHDGGATWSASANLLSYNDAVDAFPRSPDYNFATLFTPEQSPYKEFAMGELDGFLVRIDVMGGVFDGMCAVTPWPMEYHYEPPKADNDSDGSGGNENNAGSNSGGNGGDSSENGGQRPTLPDEKPPVELTPPPLESPPLEVIPPALVVDDDGADSEARTEAVAQQDVVQENSPATTHGEPQKLGTTELPEVLVQEQEKPMEPSGSTDKRSISVTDNLDKNFSDSSVWNSTATQAHTPEKLDELADIQVPPRASKEPWIPAVAASLLLIGGVMAVAASSAGRAAVAGGSSKLIAVIKHFLIRP